MAFYDFLTNLSFHPDIPSFNMKLPDFGGNHVKWKMKASASSGGFSRKIRGLGAEFAVYLRSSRVSAECNFYVNLPSICRLGSTWRHFPICSLE